MVAMGYAGTSDFTGPIKLSGNVKGASVLILGAGLAGMTAAYELRKAGYKVQILEYNNRPGGRNWSLYGGDTYTEIGGVTQKVEFAKGLYLNPGPWRLPHHHRGILYYCKLLNVALETFTMVNYNAYVHSTAGVRRQAQEASRDRGGFQRLCRRASGQGDSQDKLDGALTKDEKDGMLQIAARLGRAGQELRIQERRIRQRHARLRRSSRAAGYRPCRSIPIRCR